jgi:hypothetical protein
MRRKKKKESSIARDGKKRTANKQDQNGGQRAMGDL